MAELLLFMMKTIAAIILLGSAMAGCDSVQEGPRRESPSSPGVRQRPTNPPKAPPKAPAQPGGSPYDTPPAKPSPYDTPRSTRREAVSEKIYGALDAVPDRRGKPVSGFASHSAADWHSTCLGGDVS